MAESINKARGSFGTDNTVCRSTAYSNNTKIKIFNTNVNSVLVYGCETWNLTKTVIYQIQVLVNRCIRRIMKIFWPVQISYQELWARAKQKPIELGIRQRNWGWLGHTFRRPTGDIGKAALEWNPQGTRSCGDPEQHGAEQTLKRLDTKAKHGMKLKYSPVIVSNSVNLWGPYVPLRNDGKLYIYVYIYIYIHTSQ